jgi:hypothetical protein
MLREGNKLGPYICFWLAYCRIDPKFACRIEIIVNSYFSIIDGKKAYSKGRTVSWVVNSEEYAVIDLEKDIASYFTWANNQKANFWVVDSRLNMTCKLATDGQLLDLLRAYQVVKLLMIVGAHEEGHVGPAAVNVVGEVTSVAVNVVGEVTSVAANVVGEVTSVAANVVGEGTSAASNMLGEGVSAATNVVEEEIKVEGFAWAEIPEYGGTTAGPPMAEEEEKEHFMTSGCDPHGDEPAGANEEWRYFKKVDDAVHDARPVENSEIKVQKRKRTRLILEYDPECVLDDEAGMIGDYFAPHTTHDPENPVIKENDTFGDKEEFIQIMRTYAIKMSLRLRLNIATQKGTEQGVQLKTASGKFMQRKFMVATHLWLVFILLSYLQLIY